MQPFWAILLPLRFLGEAQQATQQIFFDLKNEEMFTGQRD